MDFALNDPILSFNFHSKKISFTNKKYLNDKEYLNKSESLKDVSGLLDS